MSLSFDYYDNVINQLKEVKENEQENIQKAVDMFCDTITKGGMIHVFGSGHSHTLSIELCHRAGGLVPIKAMDEAGRGLYEQVEGVGTRFMQNYDLQENDLVLITSNSSRNPISVEIAQYAKNMGVKVITCYAKKFAEKCTPRHSSGKMVYELADLVIDNHCVYGDATITVEGLADKVGPTSTIITAFIYDWIVVETIKQLKRNGYEPPVLRSVNIDGGEQYNQHLLDKYKYRLFYKKYLKN